MIFFKYYDVQFKFLTYCGFEHVHREIFIRELFPIVREKAGLPKGTPIALYEEEVHNMLRDVKDYDRLLFEVINHLADGDIFVFHREDVPPDPEFPTIRDYYNDLQQRVEVLFCDKNNPSDPGVLIELSLKMDYHQWANALAVRLGTDAALLQFYKNMR